MKVAVGMRVRTGPWGGGNQFAAALGQFLQDRGVVVTDTLDSPDLDVILLTDPRRSSASSAFNDIDILRYLMEVNPRAVVVHRVNECDERKRTRMVNRRLELANRCADRTVFISAWLRDLFVHRGSALAPATIIRNGGERALFRPGGRPWDGQEPLRLVTHHWGSHWMKGFDIYQRLDQLLEQPDFRKRFAFTYIGNLPTGFRFKNATMEPPQHGERLARLLQQHHVYLTASRNEPAGMHHIEGALCGLPLLYCNSGALPEYCEGFGLCFDESSFERQLLAMRRSYHIFKPLMDQYPYDAERMCSSYLSLFTELVEQRREVLAERRWSSRQSFRMRAHASLYDACYAWRLRLNALR